MIIDEIKDKSSGPLYKQIKSCLLKNINNKIFKANEAIPTERELCEVFGVSRFTVRNAIKELVEEGYLYRVQGNGTFVFSKNQREKKKSKSIGVILDFCGEEMEAKILEGTEKALDDKDYTLTYMSSNNDSDKEASSIDKLKKEGVAGLIIMPAIDDKKNKAIIDLKKEKFPFVLVDRRINGYRTDCVMSDNENGIYNATAYLIKMGHNRIALIKNDFSGSTSIQDRINGYEKALYDSGLEFKENLMFTLASSENLTTDYKGLYKFIYKEKPTAVLALSDHIALEVVKMGRKYNIKIPEQLSLIGFDNLSTVQHLETPLTTVAQFPEEIGRQAVQLLIKKLKLDNEEKNLIYQIYHPVELVKRESVKNMRK